MIAAALILALLPLDRAQSNAALTLAINGIYGARVVCLMDGPADAVCVARVSGGRLATMRCAATFRDACVLEVERR